MKKYQTVGYHTSCRKLLSVDNFCSILLSGWLLYTPTHHWKSSPKNKENKRAKISSLSHAFDHTSTQVWHLKTANHSCGNGSYATVALFLTQFLKEITIKARNGPINQPVSHLNKHKLELGDIGKKILSQLIAAFRWRWLIYDNFTRM